ncbi:hypothetical protein FRC17_004724 [Serendipita sp. 399]|nr:hypothetical protein FRC17_004724 [Serendipita sp. 399]
MASTSIHDSINSSDFSNPDVNEEFEIVSVTSDVDLHQQPHHVNLYGNNGYHNNMLDTLPLGLTAYHTSELQLPSLAPEPVAPPGVLEKFETASLSPEDVQSYVKRWVDGDVADLIGEETPGGYLDDSIAVGHGGMLATTLSGYKINKPPTMRPVRVYTAALFDVLHPGHVLNLRQAKYAFPSVHLLVGVFAHAPPHSPSIFSHLERLETVRHIRYIDELVPEAPLTLSEAFIREWNIDYVAGTVQSLSSDPSLLLAKRLGKFLPLRGTEAISTGEVLQRLRRGEGQDGHEGDLLGDIGTSGLRRHGREDTLKPTAPHLNTDFAPLTPASYHDEPDSPPAPEPHDLLDPFTN